MQKKIVDKLVDESTDTVGEVKLTITTLSENENTYKFSSYSVSTQCIFTIKISEIGAHFFYFYWYLKKDALYVNFNSYKRKTIEKTYKWEKLDKLTLKMELIIFPTTDLVPKTLMQSG